MGWAWAFRVAILALMALPPCVTPPTTSPPQFGCVASLNLQARRPRADLPPCEWVWVCYEQTFPFSPSVVEPKCLEAMRRDRP